MPSEVYSPEIHAAIALWLSGIDCLKDTSRFTPLLTSGAFQRQFGTLNFAGLEEVFRSANFYTHCLAVPIEAVNKRVDSVVAVSPDDSLRIYESTGDSVVTILETMKKVPYVAYLYPGYNEVQAASQDWEIRYDREINLAHLNCSGFMIPRPGSPLARRLAMKRNKS